MATVKLSDELVEKARIQAAKDHRSVPKQIEHWATKGMELEKAEITSQQKQAIFKSVINDFDKTLKILAK
ncbi:MAG: hypothetical protein FJ190_07090 [Gammaproteobacteria bacterium]|nr:hypothetical protein [Gammaproteobacteria bacterium]